MSYLITFLAGVLGGAIAGILAYRNNQASVEAKAKAIDDKVAADVAKAKQAISDLQK